MTRRTAERAPVSWRRGRIRALPGAEDNRQRDLCEYCDFCADSMPISPGGVARDNQARCGWIGRAIERATSCWRWRGAERSRTILVDLCEAPRRGPESSASWSLRGNLCEGLGAGCPETWTRRLRRRSGTAVLLSACLPNYARGIGFSSCFSWTTRRMLCDREGRAVWGSDR